MLPVKFLSLLNTQGPNGCWLWTRSATGRGYGAAFAIKQPDGKWKQIRAHRFSWELHYGQIPDGKCVCHKCDTPLCCNPEHLFLGTIKDNMQDCVRKGRRTKVYGDIHGSIKISDKQVSQIRDIYSNGHSSQSDLASTFGVSQQQICRIVKGKSRVISTPFNK